MGKTIATNKRARHEYHLFDTYEVGLELHGAEVKSIRNGHVSIKDAYIIIKDRQAFILNMYIGPYVFNRAKEIEEYRDRRLLLHKNELTKLKHSIAEKGLTIVPTKIYFNNRGFAKLEIAIAKGKKLYDKRESIKKRETERKIEYRLRNDQKR